MRAQPATSFNSVRMSAVVRYSALEQGRATMKLASIEAVVRALSESHVPFIVVGGLAVVAHGYGRQTQDLDLVIQLQPQIIHAAFRALASLGYHPRVPVTADMIADAQTRASWVRDRGMVVMAFHSESHTETPVDVFASEPFDFATEHEQAMVVELAPGLPVRVVRLQALLRMKRQADRPQDRADVAELSALHGGSNV